MAADLSPPACSQPLPQPEQPDAAAVEAVTAAISRQQLRPLPHQPRRLADEAASVVAISRKATSALSRSASLT